ncbi:hypothetical protein DNX69_10510 [Rhodopseudomonas palustris]|uniref:Uncharacterized protein n=1 Tax=Rhodopseudomonas palustris TaxID=1076 RepID=A0A323UJA0_RHOPL|nr:hypothetical protein DNX69_10510 [Rhodopseudomonas palustris]
MSFGKPRRRFAVCAAFLVAWTWPAAGEAACPELPPCKGCGCKGGTGYRAPDGHCVGFRELDRVCGAPPTRCVFENAPGTGANRECAAAPRSQRNSGAGPDAVPVEPVE